MAIDWRAYVRSRLPRLDVMPEREIEIVEELAIQLEATYERARINTGSEAEATARAAAEVPDWGRLACKLMQVERRSPEAPIPGVQTTGGLMTGFLQDTRCAARALARAPGFAAVAIVTLALGIAATTIVYSLVDAVLIRPLPIKDAGRVILARETSNGNEISVSWPSFLDWRARATSVEPLAAWRGLTLSLTGFGEPRRILARQVTANLFGVLGVTPVLGRDFVPADDQFGAEKTCLVSYGFWKRELGGDQSAIGRRIMLEEEPLTVIGVLPRDFTVARQEDVFVTLGPFLRPGSYVFGRGNHFGLAAIGRLKPGVSLDAANAEIVALARQIEQEHPDTNSGNGGIVHPLLDVLVSTTRPMLLVLLGAVSAMLLIACVNLANLLLSRAAGRAQEMAVRRSLGAARWRLARQMLTESVLLALAGGAAGVVLAFIGFDAIVALLPKDQARLHTVALNLRVLMVSAGVSIATGLLFGLVPALHAATGRGSLLMRNVRVTGSAQTRPMTRRLLMLAEVALALVLVTAAGLMIRTINNLLNVDTGFEPARVISANFSLPGRYNLDTRAIFVDSAVERLRALPGVTSAAFTYSLPVTSSNWNSIFIIDGQPVPARSELPSAAWTPVTAGYFETIGVRVKQGRTFAAADARNAPAVAVVNETFAKRFFPRGDAVGKTVKQGWPEEKGTWREIVGVVNDVTVSTLDGKVPLQVYLPNAQASQNSGSFVVRTENDPRTIGRAIESAIHELDANLPIYDIRSMPEVIDAGIGGQRLTMMLLIGFAVLSLVMAAIGVFGVTAYSVSQRTHEVGVRMALGARPASVLALILRQEMTACVLGVVAGVVSAVFLSSLLQSLLFGVAPRDATTLASATAVLLVVTTAACYLPARRATRVDPVRALRSD